MTFWQHEWACVRLAFSGRLRNAEMISAFASIGFAPFAVIWEPWGEVMSWFPSVIFGLAFFGLVLFGLIRAPSLLYQRVERERDEMKAALDQKARVGELRNALVRLRDEGVAFRNEGLSTRFFSEDWCSKADEWAERAFKAVAAIDEADAGWFKTLDVVPPPRIATNTPQIHIARLYGWHDFRLVKLERLMEKYGIR